MPETGGAHSDASAPGDAALGARLRPAAPHRTGRDDSRPTAPGTISYWVPLPPSERRRPLSAPPRGDMRAGREVPGVPDSYGRLGARRPMRRMGMPITPATATHNPSNGTADAILLELVDENGVTIGTAEKLAAHQPPGQLHRAFSVFLFDEHGPAAAPAARAGQVPLPRRVVQHLLRPPLPRRGALRGGGAADLRGAGRLPVPAGRGRHGPLQPPGPGLGAGGAGVQPPLRRPGAGRAAAGPGGGRGRRPS